MTPRALLLAPGAGGSGDQRILVRLERNLAPFPVVRIEFPYRLAGRRAPDRPEVAIELLRAETARVAADLGIEQRELVLGGRSYGGRMCSMAIAQGLPAAGLVLLSYPLHPPGRPEQLRVEHFPRIEAPVLFIGGSADPFGSSEEFERWTPTIPGPVTCEWLPGGHDPGAAVDQRIVTAVARWLVAA